MTEQLSMGAQQYETRNQMQKEKWKTTTTNKQTWRLNKKPGNKKSWE